MSKYIGFDPGTSNLVLAFEDGGKAKYITERNTFNLITPVTNIHRNMLVKSLEKINAKYIEIDNQICVVGQHAIDLANSGSGKVYRPMATGKINPAEKKARRILRFLIQKMVEPYIEKGTKVVFSCTGNAVDLPEDQIFDTGAHRDFLSSIFTELGATIQIIDEAEAVAYSQLLENGLTGMTMSCLHPDTDVETARGLIPIKNVKIGDLVRTSGHTYNKVLKTIISQKQNETLYRIKVSCGGSYTVTGDHKILTTEGWIEAQNLTLKHKLKEPVNEYNPKRNSYSFYRYVNFPAFRDFSWFLGLWLGDGYASKEGKIEICLGQKEVHLIDKLKIVVQKYFKQELKTKEDRGMVRCRFYDSKFALKLRQDYYDDEKNKIFPFDIHELSSEAVVGLLQGLIDADGYLSVCSEDGTKKISFTNTSPALWTLFRNGLSILGLTGKIYDSTDCNRKPTLCEDGHYIPSVKKRYCEVQVNGAEAEILEYYFANRVSKKVITSGGYKIFGLNSIEKIEDYNGDVYDLAIEENHDFTAPGICFHNCGAGTISSGIFLGGQPITTFCTSKAGDYIDMYAAQSDVDWTPSIVQAEKEKMDLGKPQNEMQEVIQSYYQRLFKYTVQNIAQNLNDSKQLSRFTQPIDMVVSGGTIAVKGAVELFTKVVKENNFPLPIANVKKANNPLYVTADGCLVAASL